MPGVRNATVTARTAVSARSATAAVRKSPSRRLLRPAGGDRLRAVVRQPAAARRQARRPMPAGGRRTLGRMSIRIGRRAAHDGSGTPGHQPWIVRPRLLTVGEQGERHASWLELFFDLVFVVAVTELSRELVLRHSPMGFLLFAALFIPVYVAWQGFMAYATRFDTDDRPHLPGIHQHAAEVTERPDLRAVIPGSTQRLSAHSRRSSARSYCLPSRVVVRAAHRLTSDMGRSGAPGAGPWGRPAP